MLQRLERANGDTKLLACFTIFKRFFVQGFHRSQRIRTDSQARIVNDRGHQSIAITDCSNDGFDLNILEREGGGFLAVRHSVHGSLHAGAGSVYQKQGESGLFRLLSSVASQYDEFVRCAAIENDRFFTV